MANLHAQSDTIAEVQAVCGDLLAPAILGSTLAVPVPPSLTLPAFSAYGYVNNGSPTRLVYVNQPAAAVTLAGSNGAYWLALHHDTHTAVASWTRQPGTHYLWQANATRPADPPGGLVLAGLTVAGGAITASDTSLNYPVTKVAFGGATGGLAFDSHFTWNGSVLSVLPGTVTATFVTATNNLQGYYVGAQGPPDTRFSLRSYGASYFDGPVNIASEAGNMLNVGGNAYVSGYLAVGMGPAGPWNVMAPYIRAITGMQTDGSLYVGTTLSVSGHLGAASTVTVAGVLRASSYFIASAEAGFGREAEGGFSISTASHIRSGGDLYVAGVAYKPGGGGFADSSSRTLKRNIGPIPDALGLLLAQQGRAFEWEEPTRAALLPGVRYGLIAEEVTLPQWTDGQGHVGAQGFEALVIESLRAIVERLERLEERPHARTD